MSEFCGKQLAVDRDLEQRLKDAAAFPMTADELFEQKVSWVYGQQALSGGTATKDEIRKRLEQTR